jgi:hypothetical protein
MFCHPLLDGFPLGSCGRSGKVRLQCEPVEDLVSIHIRKTPANEFIDIGLSSAYFQ